jgi:hypothetical protein
MLSRDDIDRLAVRHAADRRLAEALALIEEAARTGARLRLVGGLAAYRYAVDRAFMARAFSDIDLVGYSREVSRSVDAFARLGYRENRHVAQATAGQQLQFVRGARPVDHVDVFLDVIRMDHDVDARKRLGIDPFAISPADILLTKLQIGQIAAKDLHDVVALLKDVPLSDRDDNTSINASRLARACARDWGLYHDVVANLELVASGLTDFPLSNEERELVTSRLAALRTAISGEDKSFRWRLRARVGTRLPWRREVEDREGSPLIVRAPTAGKRTVLSCIDCHHAVEVSTELADLPAAPLACPRCGSVDLRLQPPEAREPAAA